MQWVYYFESKDCGLYFDLYIWKLWVINSNSSFFVDVEAGVIEKNKYSYWVL